MPQGSKTAGGIKVAVRQQYRAGSYPDVIHPSSPRLRRDKAAERLPPEAKVPSGTKTAEGIKKLPSGTKKPPEA